MSEQPMITFATHQVRAGQAGASEDFEQMLGLLVRATSGREANLIFANPGDWGIDVLVGDLHGRVTVWQAKYFVRGVGRSQQSQIRSSFAAAVKAAADHGYTLERWVLCIPASLDGPTTQWWHRWKAEQERDDGISIDLWDETRLRELLLRPRAADVYRHYYAPYLRRSVPGAAGAADSNAAFREGVSRAAEELAVAVDDQWRREERMRRIQDPVPLPVRWIAADPLLSDHSANILRLADDVLDLDGSLREALDVFTRIPSRRLVVVGRAGAGKTVFTLRFTLDLLAHRQPGDQVPVIFGLHTWNPLDESLQEWLAAQLAADYPALRNADRSGQSVASALVRQQRILPVLDGLDEVSQSLRSDALRALNMCLDNDTPVIVTCREPDYRQLVADADVLTSAAVIELVPLELRDLADYLPRTTRKIPSTGTGGFGTKWDRVLQRMRTDPADPACRMLLEVLSTPLMTSLARSIYSDTAADPAVLLDGAFADQRDIEAHLLSAFIPAAFSGPVTRGTCQPRPSPRPQDAERWLKFLARHLDRLGTQDIEWWRLENAVPRPIRWLTSGVVAWLAVCVGFAMFGAAQPWKESITAPVGVAAGLTLGLALITAKLPLVAADQSIGRLRLLLRRSAHAGAVAAPAGIVAGFSESLGPFDPPPSSALAEIINLIFPLLLGVAVGVVLGAAGASGKQSPTTTPLRLHQKFRTLSKRLFRSIVHGLLNGVVVGLAFWVVGSLAYGGAGEFRMATAAIFPVGYNRIYHLPQGGSYANYAGGLRYVINGKGNRYITTTRKVEFYLGYSQGKSDGFFYPSRASCIFYANRAEERCRAHSPEVLRYTNSGYALAVTLPNEAKLTDIADSDLKKMEWLNPLLPREFFVSAMEEGLIIGLLFVFPGALIGSLFLWLGLPADITHAIGPSSTLRTDRNAAVFRGVISSTLISLPAAAVLLHVHDIGGSEPGVAVRVALASATIGLLAVTLSCWIRLHTAVIWLAFRGQLPWRLMLFLEDARARGALRQAGATYQFRHARLQEQLVASAKAADARVPRQDRIMRTLHSVPRA